MNAGSVRLMDGTTGTPIGAALTGDVPQDRVGSSGVHVLPNGNFVVGSRLDDEGGVVNAGSVRLVDGTTGAPIGVPLTGDTLDDHLGLRGVIVLSNGNFLVRSPDDDEGGVVNAGSVRLVDGTTGAPIGVPLTGDLPADLLGSSAPAALSNGNYVVTHPRHDEGGVVNAGSVRLVDGTTGLPIGMPFTGDMPSDELGLVTALPNGNFVIRAPLDDEAGVVDAGSVRLVDGTTGAPIGAALTGNVEDDQLGSGGVVVLANGNFVIASPKDDEGGVANAGSVRLVDGTTGVPIGVALTGDAPGDQLGSGGVRALPNGNFVIASPKDDEGGVVNAGSVRLVDGATGAEIGVALTGDFAGDQLGLGGVTALLNGNYVVASPEDDEGGIANAGSARLVDGTTGAQIAMPLTGDMADDELGLGGVHALPNGNFLVRSRVDDEGGVVNAGSLRLVNGTTGAPIGAALTGASPLDMQLWSVATPSHGAFFVVGFAHWNDPDADSGRVRLIAE